MEKIDSLEWLSTYQGDYGKCYSLMIPKWISDLKVRGLFFQFKITTVLFTTYPGQLVIDPYIAGLTLSLGDNLAFNLGYKVMIV